MFNIWGQNNQKEINYEELLKELELLAIKNKVLYEYNLKKKKAYSVYKTNLTEIENYIQLISEKQELNSADIESKLKNYKATTDDEYLAYSKKIEERKKNQIEGTPPVHPSESDSEPDSNPDNTENKDKMTKFDEDKVEEIFNKILKSSFDGSNPGDLQPTIDALDLLQSRITHAENQTHLIKLVRTRICGTARTYIQEATTIKRIIEILEANFKGSDPKTIKSKINILSKKDTNFVKEVEELADKLKIAYISNGYALKHANELTVEIVKDVLEKQVGDSPANKNMFIKQFPSVDSVIEVYNELETRSKANSATINYIHNKRGRQQHPRGFGRGNFKGPWRGQNQWRGQGQWRGRGQWRDRRQYEQGQGMQYHKRNQWRGPHGREIRAIAAECPENYEALPRGTQGESSASIGKYYVED